MSPRIDRPQPLPIKARKKGTSEQERELSEAAKLTCAWETTCQTEEEE